ncbi:hypothetical protein EUX98_g1622 [Antrodiella citrinella]|uniref:Uncharacterized protein n=1 Tax=Antrodiella citrinella TaxID=2447956 RepID=A0A4V3XJC7_9APHY|nr:hypothetical protein EUX98_g1622 [Antrodiella citrinella]
MASTSLYIQPTTPTSHRHGFESYAHAPQNSSPLASSPISHKSSPISAAHARRRDQFKTAASSSSNYRRKPAQTRTAPSSSRQKPPASDGVALEAPRKAVLREQFKARCLERAQRDRARRVSGARGLSSGPSSDDVDADMEDASDEEEEEFLNDELFSRIMQNVNRKQKHQYKLSYHDDVGSSFDPELDDVDEWENDLRIEKPLNTEPEDLDEEELAAYAEEYQVLQDLQGIAVDDIFSLSDLEDIPEEESFDWKGKGRAPQLSFQDMDMD